MSLTPQRSSQNGSSKHVAVSCPVWLLSGWKRCAFALTLKSREHPARELTSFRAIRRKHELLEIRGWWLGDRFVPRRGRDGAGGDQGSVRGRADHAQPAP